MHSPRQVASHFRRRKLASPGLNSGCLNSRQIPSSQRKKCNIWFWHQAQPPFTMFPQKVTISNDTANSQIMPGLVVCVFFFFLVWFYELGSKNSFQSHGKKDRCMFPNYYCKLNTNKYMVTYHLPLYLKHPPTYKDK